MFSPWWTHIAFYLLLASTLLPANVLCYPVRATSDIESAYSYSDLYSRTTPSPPRKKARVKSPSPDAASSPSQHSSGNPRTPSPHGSPGSLPNNIKPTPGKKIKNQQKHERQKVNLKSKQLKSKDYRDNAKMEHPHVDWKQHQADHVLEAQTVSSKINKHISGRLSEKCISVLQKPINERKNVLPLGGKLNSEKNAIVHTFATHDLYSHEHGPNKGTQKRIKKMSPELKKYVINNKDQMRQTAKAVDTAMEHKDCHQLHGTPLYKGGKVLAQADHIIAHAHAS